MRVLPRLRDGFAQVKHYRNSTYGPLMHYPSSGSSVSDLFVGREGSLRTRFHGENTLALVLGKRLPVEHRIVIVSRDGRIIDELRLDSDDFRVSIDLPTVGDNLYSFIHLTNYSDKTLDALSADRRLIARNHRGYTGYLTCSSSMESVVHGNFGLMYLGKDGALRSLARQKSVHRYTVQEVFGAASQYELCFPNPTSQPLRLQVEILNRMGSAMRTVSQVIQPFGVWMFQFEGEQLSGEHYLSWYSRLPVGRCLVFEINDQMSTCNVFHS